MIDSEFNVRRYITEFSKKTERLVAKHELSSFNLSKFQVEFRETDTNNPMFDCYQITENNLPFISLYLENELAWDFSKNSYFVECDRLE